MISIGKDLCKNIIRYIQNRESKFNGKFKGKFKRKFNRIGKDLCKIITRDIQNGKVNSKDKNHIYG